MNNFFVNWLNNFRNHKGELAGGWATIIILFFKAERRNGDKEAL